MSIAETQIGKDGFRLRGTAMSRVDGFSDVVFGFALTLLVVALEVPRTYAELHANLLGFFPFAISFTLLIMIWFAHYRFFRRFGLHDDATIALNAALLFVVLFYVYPLKFLFNLMLPTPNAANIFSNAYQMRQLMVLYGLGFTVIYLLFASLYGMGWRHREELQLNRLERALTLYWLVDHLGVACVGLLSVIIAFLLPIEQSGNAGWTFFAIAIVKTVHGTIGGRYLRRIRASDAVGPA